ncbi:MAG: hypothetical protein ACLR5Y_01015 [Haemophilus parainfluenzae]
MLVNFSGFTATQVANVYYLKRLIYRISTNEYPTSSRTEFVDYARTRLGDDNVGMILTSGSAEARETRTQLINEYAAQFEESLRNIHDGNGMKVLGSQGGFSGGNTGGQSGLNGGVPSGQVENHVGNRGFDYEEQAKK